MYINYLEIEEEKITYELIEKNNSAIIEEIKDDFKDKDTVTIIGKGESAKYINDAIGINQAIIFTNKKYLFMNDFISFFGIEEFIKDIKYLFVSDYPHNGKYAEINLSYKNVIRYLKKYSFTGKLFIYQIQTTLSKYKFDKYMFQSMTTTDIPITFFNKFIGINIFELYGVGKGSLYHKDLLNLNFTHINSDVEYLNLFNQFLFLYKKCFDNALSLYNDNRQTMFLKHFENIKNRLGLKINFN